MNELTLSRTMSSLEIAELTGKEHFNVLADIRTMLSELKIDALKFQGSYLSQQNKQLPMLELDKELTITLISGYSIKLRHTIIKRWRELEEGEHLSLSQFIDTNTLFKSNLEIARLLFDGNPAIISANIATIKVTGVDVLSNMDVKLISSVQENSLPPSGVGVELQMSGQAVNKLLTEKGYQVVHRDHKNKPYYEPTEKGETLSEMVDTGKKRGDGTPVKQLKWYSSIIKLLKDD